VSRCCTAELIPSLQIFLPLLSPPSSIPIMHFTPW
jgi:hypothetical protein